MRTRHLAAGIAALGAAAALAGLVSAQDNKTAPAPAVVVPPITAPAAPVTTAVPNTPAAKGLATAVTPEEVVPPPKAEIAPRAAPKLAAAPQPPKPPAEPLKRARYDSAVLQAVDKITAETLRFESKVGEPVRYKGLIVTVRSCEASAPDEISPDNIAYLDVQSQPISSPGHAAAAPRQVFRGWLFASSPGLHPFEHPIYDIWLIACKASAPVAPAAAIANPVAPRPAAKMPGAPAKAAANRT